MSGVPSSDRTPLAILPLIVANLPLADLAPYPHCVTWDPEWRDGRNGKPGGWTKVLKNPHTGRNARSNDPTTCGMADVVLDLYDRFGYVVFESDPFTFLDVDNAIDRETGKPKPWAQDIVGRFPDGYWEISTTGGGLKGLIRGRPPRNRIVKIGDGQLEIFFSGKFTALSGHRLPESSETIGECQAALDALYAELCPEPTPAPITPIAELDLDDREILERVRRMEKGRRLFDAGDLSLYGDDHSAADLGLLNCFVSAGATNADQLDRLFRASALMREKWNRKDYRARSIAEALDGTVVPFEGWTLPAAQLVRPSIPSKNRAVMGNPQDAGYQEPEEPEPLAATGTDGLPDDIPSLKAIIRELTRRIETAERRADIAERRAIAAERKAAMLGEVQSTTARIIGNKALGQERFTAVALSHRFAHLQSTGNAGDDGLYPITLHSIAESAGISEDSASKHIGKLVDAGVLKKELRWIPPGVDPVTGEIVEGHKRQFIAPATGDVVDFVAAVANLRPEKPKTWGGRPDRCQPCPDHPHARIIKRVTYICEECGQELGREPDTVIESTGPNPQDAGHQNAPAGPAAAAHGSVDTTLISRSARVSDNHAEFSEGHAGDPTPGRAARRARATADLAARYGEAPPRGARTLRASGPPATEPRKGCLDCGAAVDPDEHYCPAHGGRAPDTEPVSMFAGDDFGTAGFDKWTIA